VSIDASGEEGSGLVWMEGAQDPVEVSTLNPHRNPNSNPELVFS
jgi:hypothetical protein